MKLVLARGKDKHNGFMLTDMDTETTYMYVDGNHSKHVPVALLSIDAHIIYGMSHPAAVSRIFASGPQILLTTKRLAHSLYEHGMKAAWGSIMLGSTPVFTQLSSFYDLQETQSVGNIVAASVHSLPKEEKAYLKIAYQGKLFVISPLA
jgi:hypothetical protein